METINFERKDLIEDPLWWQKEGLQQTASGYGSKLTTQYKVNYKGRLRRIYSACFSNVGVPYIIYKGEKVGVNVF